jgi:phytoene desaturase
VRLDPAFRYHWADGSALDVRDDPAATARAFEAFSPGAGDAYRSFLSVGERIWTVAERTFLAGAIGGPRELAARMRSPRDLFAIDPMRTLHRMAATHFVDPRLQQWASRYATYSGSSPYRAPATLACIAHVEAAYGCWYPVGGLSALRDALVRAARAVGVEVRCDVDVASIRPYGLVETTDGERISARHVVANVDAVHLYRDLVQDQRLTRRVRRAEPSGSGFVILAGVRGRTPGIGHHNVWFSPSYADEYDALDHGRVAHEPTIYACVSSVTDPAQAPTGHENWFLLVNVPPAPLPSPDAYAALVLDRLAARGVDLRHRLCFTELITPTDLARRYRAEGGAIYGTSSNGRRAAFVRPANRSLVPGLFLVGGSSHPGGGLPLVATSGRIVADMILAER